MRVSQLRRALFLLLLPAYASAADPKVTTLDVPGMYCSLCNISVRKTLERVPGVVEAKADNDPDKVSPADLAAALTKGGYPASVRAQ